MAICDRGGHPIAVHVASASPYEPRLVPATLDARVLPDLPWCLIGDRGYDSDRLDDLLMTQYGIEMIAANRRGRAKTQAGRPLRRAEAPLENRTALCLAPQLPPRGHPPGATGRELPGHGAARLCPDFAPGIYEIASSVPNQRSVDEFSEARRPDGKARQPRISGIFKGGAMQPAGMPRPDVSTEL